MIDDFFQSLIIFAKSSILGVQRVLNTPLRIDRNNNYITAYQTLLAIFQRKCYPFTIISGIVPNAFLGEIILVFPVVYYQTWYLEMWAMISIMKQMLILLKQNRVCLPKARGFINKGWPFEWSDTQILRNMWGKN